MPREEKVLLGVTHVPETEKLTKAMLDELKFSRIGLELSPFELTAALHPRKFANGPEFFGRLAAYYNNFGIEVIPIDHPTIKEDVGGNSFAFAFDIVTNAVTVEQVEEAVKKLEKKADLSVHSLERIERIRDIDKLKLALRIAERGEGVITQMDQINEERNRYMRDAIIFENISVAVIGDFHARAIIQELPEHCFISIDVRRD